MVNLKRAIAALIVCFKPQVLLTLCILLVLAHSIVMGIYKGGGSHWHMGRQHYITLTMTTVFLMVVIIWAAFFILIMRFELRNELETLLILFQCSKRGLRFLGVVVFHIGLLTLVALLVSASVEISMREEPARVRRYGSTAPQEAEYPGPSETRSDLIKTQVYVKGETIRTSRPESYSVGNHKRDINGGYVVTIYKIWLTALIYAFLYLIFENLLMFYADMNLVEFVHVTFLDLVAKMTGIDLSDYPAGEMLFNPLRAFKVLNNWPKSIQADKDFFGISNVTSKIIAGCTRSDAGFKRDDLAKKYQPLRKRRDYLANEQIEHELSFGTIRRDEENEPTSHGQYEPSNDKRRYDTIDIKQRFVPSQDNSSTEEFTINKKDDEGYQDESSNIPDSNAPYRVADIKPKEALAFILKQFQDPKPLETAAKYANTPPLTFFFESTSEKEPDEQTINPDTTTLAQDSKLTGRKLAGEELEKSINEAPDSKDRKLPLVYDADNDKIPLHEKDPVAEDYFERQAEVLEDHKFDETLYEKYDINETKAPMKALEYIKLVRAQKIEPSSEGLKRRLRNEQPYLFTPSFKLDSLGFKNYEGQVPDWRKCRHIDLLNYIKRSIVYHNYDILAVNKPYGIASHEENRKSEPFDMNSLMQELAASLRLDKVYLAHRLDKSTTGVLLFATSQERARNLNKLFKSDQIKKTYWCITRGVPELDRAIIDIPIGEFEVGGKMRSCLAPVGVKEERHLCKRYREARRAITEYRVLEATRQVSLLEVRPRSGVKHQIRCHLSFGLNRPILGDHKYSHLGRIAPQLLPEPLLKVLHLRQAKVRTLPLHLHAKSVVIPGAKANGETLFIDAQLPLHFVQNLKTLKLMSSSISEAVK